MAVAVPPPPGKSLRQTNLAISFRGAGGTTRALAPSPATLVSSEVSPSVSTEARRLSVASFPEGCESRPFWKVAFGSSKATNKPGAASMQVRPVGRKQRLASQENSSGFRAPDATERATNLSLRTRQPRLKHFGLSASLSPPPHPTSRPRPPHDPKRGESSREDRQEPLVLRSVCQPGGSAQIGHEVSRARVRAGLPSQRGSSGWTVLLQPGGSELVLRTAWLPGVILFLRLAPGRFPTFPSTCPKYLTSLS